MAKCGQILEFSGNVGGNPKWDLGIRYLFFSNIKKNSSRSKTRISRSDFELLLIVPQYSFFLEASDSKTSNPITSDISRDLKHPHQNHVSTDFFSPQKWQCKHQILKHTHKNSIIDGYAQKLNLVRFLRFFFYSSPKMVINLKPISVLVCKCPKWSRLQLDIGWTGGLLSIIDGIIALYMTSSWSGNRAI